MGSVSIDVHKQEREFRELTLSDENVVQYLILLRYELDKTYGVTNSLDVYKASETFTFNQELVALYASLDQVLHKIKIKDKERKLLELLFEGNSISDIINLYGYAQRTAYRILDRIVMKVVEENKKDWMRFITVYREGR